MPRLIHAVLQQAVERPPQHFFQVAHPAQKNVAAGNLAFPLGKKAHEMGQGTLADAPLSADKADLEMTLRAGFHHAVKAGNLTVASDKELDGYGLSRPEWT